MSNSIFITLLSFLLYTLPLHAQNKVVLPIATEHYPPYEMLEAVDGLKGFDYEVLVEIFTRLGYKLKIEFLPWKRALAYTQRGTTLGILTCAYTKEREDYIIYSNPISKRTTGYYVRKGFKGPTPLTIADVKGQRVASVSAYASLNALIEVGIMPIGANDTKSAISMLQRNRFDYLYLNRQSTDFIINQLGLSNLFTFHPINHKEFFFCFSKKYKGVSQLITSFNKMLETLRKDGTYKKIHDKYH